MKLHKKRAFTLVELVVVITILAILGTIAFISLQWYSKDQAGWEQEATHQEVPFAQLFVSVLNKLGVKTESFAGYKGGLARVWSKSVPL